MGSSWLKITKIQNTKIKLDIQKIPRAEYLLLFSIIYNYLLLKL